MMVWNPVSLPYFKLTSSLPESIPSADEIRASNGARFPSAGSTVVAVSSRILVKYGDLTREREGQALLFLESEAPSIPVPRLYAMFRDGKDTFLVMQRITGIALSDMWATLSAADKERLMSELKDVLRKLRALDNPWPNMFCDVTGGAMPHHLFYSPDQNPSVCGPFAHELSLNLALIQRYKEIQLQNQQPLFRAAFYERNVANSLWGHRSTFTHGDVQLKNILLVTRETHKDQPTAGEQMKSDIALVDWEYSGWYPDYWEYFSAFTAFQWRDDWCERLEDALPAWPAETAMMHMLYTDLFF